MLQPEEVEMGSPRQPTDWAWWFLLASACAVASITTLETALALAGIAWIVQLARALRWSVRGRGPDRVAPPAGARCPDPRLTGLLAGLAGWSVVSAVFSTDPSRSLEATLASLIWIAAPMASVVLTPRRRRLVSALLLLQAGLMGAWAVSEYFWWWDGDPLARVRGPYSNHMTLAGVLMVCTLQALPRGDLAPLLRGAAARWAGRVAVALGLAGTAATLTRSSVLGVATGLAVLVITRPVGSATTRRLRILAAGLTVAVLAGAVSLPWLLDLDRPGDLPAAAASVKDRLILWRAGLEMIRERPLVGIGAHQARREADRFIDPGYRRPGPPLHLHSAPLTLAAERGLPALLLAGALFLLTFRRIGVYAAAGDEPLAMARGAGAAVAGFLVMGLFEDNFGDAEVVFVHLLTLSALWAPASRYAVDRALPSAGPPAAGSVLPPHRPAAPGSSAGGREGSPPGEGS
jgi:O-antigen ligase